MPRCWRQCPVVLAVLWASSAEAVGWSIAVGADVGQTQRGWCVTTQEQWDAEAAAGRFYKPGECPFRMTPAYYFDARYSGKHWSAYIQAIDSRSSTQNFGAGVELYKTWFSGRFLTGLGLAYAQPDAIVESGPRYVLRFAWCPRWAGRVCGEAIHQSCFNRAYDSSLVPNWLATCDEDDLNRGYNILTVRVRFKR